ncbi:hypothetical protein HPB47_015955 [Ixodes persulcatus]|uniref:Uncharacterized protein n=1 Tax=Ixodes persulcatus TaxID=34615 RepID=A0AC60QT16_IXOPE|nr:hypothetical protein HPB47_015955 [Ixodes persulcatus]
MSTRTPSLTASQRAATDRYSVSSSICGTSLAKSEYEASAADLAEDLAAGQHSNINVLNAEESQLCDMELNDDEEGWQTKGGKKRKKTDSNSSKSTDTVTHSPKVTEGLTVIFVSTVENQLIAALSSLKLSSALEQMCPECILEVRPNKRLNLIAVDTRNGQTTRTLLACSELCGMKVRAYEPVSRHYAVGVITDVDPSLSEVEIEQNVRSPEGRVARLRRLGKSTAYLYSRNAPYSAESVARMDIERRLASDLLFVAAAETYMRATLSVRRKKSVSTVDNLTLPHLHPAPNGRKKARLATTHVNMPMIFVLQGQLSNSLRQPTQLKMVNPLQAHRKEGMIPSRSVMSALWITLQHFIKKAKRRKENLN